MHPAAIIFTSSITLRDFGTAPVSNIYIEKYNGDTKTFVGHDAGGGGGGGGANT